MRGPSSIFQVLKRTNGDLDKNSQQKTEKSNNLIGNYFEPNYMKKIPSTTSRAEVKRNIIQNLNLEKYIDQFKSKNVVEIDLDKK